MLFSYMIHFPYKTRSSYRHVQQWQPLVQQSVRAGGSSGMVINFHWRTTLKSPRCPRHWARRCFSTDKIHPWRGLCCCSWGSKPRGAGAAPTVAPTAIHRRGGSRTTFPWLHTDPRVIVTESRAGAGESPGGTMGGARRRLQSSPVKRTNAGEEPAMPHCANGGERKMSEPSSQLAFTAVETQLLPPTLTHTPPRRPDP